MCHNSHLWDMEMPKELIPELEDDDKLDFEMPFNVEEAR